MNVSWIWGEHASFPQGTFWDHSGGMELKASGHGAHENPICSLLYRCCRSSESSCSKQNFIGQMYSPMTPIGQSGREGQTDGVCPRTQHTHMQDIKNWRLWSCNHLWERLTWTPSLPVLLLDAPDAETLKQNWVWGGKNGPNFNHNK